MPPLQRVLCMLAPCPCGFSWLGTGVAAALPLGWSCPTEKVQGGLGQTNGDRWVWGPTEPLLHIWPHLVAPSAAPWGGHSVTLVGTKGVWALCTHRWRCCCWGQGAGRCPCSCSDPAGRRRVWGHLRVCHGCLFILTSSSSPPGLEAERTQQRGRLHTVQDLLPHR